MVDITKLIVSSDHNAFKNRSVQRGELDIPASIAAGQTYTQNLVFNLSEAANFIQAYAFATDYAEYFEYLDSQYHNKWRQINSSAGSGNSDYLLRTVSSGLWFFLIRLSVNGSTVTATISIRNTSGSTLTPVHPTMKIPITFIEYTLDK